MKERFEDLQADQDRTTIRDVAYDYEEPTRIVEVPLPDVVVTSRGFVPNDDLITETRLLCWELAERSNFHGEIEVTFNVDLKTGWDDTYTATVVVKEGPVFPKLCGLGSDPYEALSHALSSGR